MLDLASLERLCFEDPALGVETALRNPVESASYYSLLGNGFRRLGRFEDAERNLNRAFELAGDDFERTEIVLCYALLEFSRCRWSGAFVKADDC